MATTLKLQDHIVASNNYDFAFSLLGTSSFVLLMHTNTSIFAGTNLLLKELNYSHLRQQSEFLVLHSFG